MTAAAAAGTVGCLDAVPFLGSDPMAFSAAPSTVPAAVREAAGYEETNRSELEIERTVEAAGQTQQVVVTNQLVEYGKGVDFGPLDLPIAGRVQAAIVTALTTPQVDVLGRTFNPVADMSAADLAAMVQSRYEGLDDVEQVGEETATVAGSPTTVGEFETRAQLVGPGVGVDLTLHISQAVAVGSDLVVAVGGYPSLARRRERDDVFSMFDGIEHQG